MRILESLAFLSVPADANPCNLRLYRVSAHDARVYAREGAPTVYGNGATDALLDSLNLLPLETDLRRDVAAPGAYEQFLVALSADSDTVDWAICYFA